MAKLFCLLNNHKDQTQEKIACSLNYNHGWQKKIYKDKDVFLGGFQLPSKKESDFWLEDEEFVLMLDGEILAWSRLPKDKSTTTTKRLLALFKEEREGLVKYVNGDFSLIIWNKKKRQLSIMNDRMGLRPLYYSQYSNKVFFASEVKAIISDPDFKKQINMQSVMDFFTYEYILEDETLFKGIKVFPFASRVILSPDNNNLDFRRYWDFSFKENKALNEPLNGSLHQFKEVISQAVRRNMQGDLKIGLALSGGLDSRMIGAMIEKKYYPMHTFSFGEVGCDDEKYAKRVSKALEGVHHYVGIKHNQIKDFIEKGVFHCDGMISCNHYQILHIVEEMKEYAQICLKGFLGDMLSGGASQTSCSNKDNGQYLLYSWLDVFGMDLRERIFSRSFENEIGHAKNRFLTLFQNMNEKYKHNSVLYLKLTQRQRRFINYGMIQTRNFIEARMPFTDYDFMDFCLGLPIQLRNNQLLYKEIFVKFFPKLASIPQEGRGLALNANRLEKIINQKKRLLKAKFGISSKKACDYGKWYRTILKDFVSSMLLSQRFKERRIFNFKEVKKLLDRHFKGEFNYEKQVGILLTFEIWNRLFFDGEAV